MWGGFGGAEGKERTSDKVCFCSMDRLGLQTAADWGFGTWYVEPGWTLANPCPAVALGQGELYKKALPDHLNEKTEISDTPSCLFKMTMFLLVLK